MQNDHHDEFEGQEGSEYHFSDEDVHYEGEEGAKVEEHTPSPSPTQESIVNRIMHSKRLLMSGVVFIVLVFAVYKMVAPTNTEPSTEIATAAPPPTPAAPSPIVAQAPAVIPVTTPNVNTQTVTAPAISTQPVMTSSATTTPPVTAAPVVTTPPVVPQSNMQPYQQVIPAQPTVVTVNTGSMPPPSTGDTSSIITNPAPVQQVNPSLIISNSSNIDERIAQLSASNERLIGQLQGQYAQQYNDFANQTRAIQEQVQSLNARVSTMEGQLNQLIQALTKKNAMGQTGGQTGAMNTHSGGGSPRPSQAPDIKVAYNVQAIIPGRAWLKAENGETLTVAEGDQIKGVGKVTKIDPYDGIVELNTGTRSISLSYGENV